VELRELERSDLWKKAGGTLQTIRAKLNCSGEGELAQIVERAHRNRGKKRRFGFL